MTPTTALRLHSGHDAVTLFHADDLSLFCLTDDNGAEPDGPAWLMWDTTFTTTPALADFTARGINAELVPVYVCEYHPDYRHPEQFMPNLAPWMGHQTSGQIAFTLESDAIAYEQRVTLGLEVC